jgi:LytR cell envelope-related transcriptional attenuator
MNLSTGRILVIVGLIVAGLAVLANGFTGDSGISAGPMATASPTESPSGTGSPTDTATPTETPAPQTKGVLIMVLNGTDVPGAGAAAQTMLVDDGYKAPADATNAPVQGVKKTTVYYRDDDNAAQNKADATYVAKQYFKGAPVKPLDTDTASAVPPNVSVVVVVGQDYATKLTQ